MKKAFKVSCNFLLKISIQVKTVKAMNALLYIYVCVYKNIEVYKITNHSNCYERAHGPM